MYNPKLHFHFIGIGGAGMSGIAEVLLNQGFQISGSDLNFSTACKRLAELGAKIYTGHDADNLADNISLIVYSSAIATTNPEMVEAKNRLIPILSRAEVLAELMRFKYGVAIAGAHGKTSTSSLISAVMEEAKFDPTVIIGGIVHKYNSTGKLGKGDFLVAEADESDKSFLHLKPTIAVVTNIDKEHLSTYGTVEEIEKAFAQFVKSVPFYGLAVMCVDDPRVSKIYDQLNCRKISYGLSAKATLRAKCLKVSPQGTEFEVFKEDESLGIYQIPLVGRHFMLNCLSVFAVAMEFGISLGTIKDALSSFQGVSRRSEIVACQDGVTIINDYAHHPTEIKATLSAISEAYHLAGRVHVIFQPHRYSRTAECWDEFQNCFENCDHVMISDIYSAGELEIEQINAENLAQSIAHQNCSYAGTLDDCYESLKTEFRSGDVLVCMGAGSIGNFAKNIVPRHA